MQKYRSTSRHSACRQWCVVMVQGLQLRLRRVLHDWIFACCVPGLVMPALGYVAQTLTGLAVPLLWGIVACRAHLDGVRRPWHAPACVEGAAIKLCWDVTKQESASQAYPGVCAMVAKLWGCSESRLERTCGIWHCHGSIEQTACALA